jgi:uncharacterized protein YkwD
LKPLPFALVPLALGALVAAAPARPASYEAALLARVNAVRAAHHLRPLRSSPGLHRAAAQHSDQMARDGYFSHSSADGAAFWRRILRFYGKGGYRYWSVGENLAWAAPQLSAARTVTLWLHSPEHRANLLAPRWREIGLAAVHVTSGHGVYAGYSATIVTADFGVRR